MVRAVHRAVDPLVYAMWYAVNRWTTRNPRTFNEKVRYKMVHDRRRVLTLFADKVAVRDYVEDKLGRGYLPALYQVHDSATAIRWNDLPREFVCKASHASGGAILVTSTADPSVSLPDYTPAGHRRFVVHPDAFDPERATQLLERWRTMPYGWAGWKREWAYKDVRPRVLIEELLRDATGSIPADYKCYVFGGRCRLVEVHQGRFDTFVVDRYTRDWEYLPFDWVGVPRSGIPKPPPARLDDLLHVAETLGEDMDFVRVDLYLLGDRIVFGELTHYPAGGNGPFDPAEYDVRIGSWWNAPRRYS